MQNQNIAANDAILWKENWEKLLFEAGLHFDMSSDGKQFQIMYPDFKNGTEWWPGYYEKWFSSGIGYRGMCYSYDI